MFELKGVFSGNKGTSKRLSSELDEVETASDSEVGVPMICWPDWWVKKPYRCRDNMCQECPPAVWY